MLTRGVQSRAHGAAGKRGGTASVRAGKRGITSALLALLLVFVANAAHAQTPVPNFCGFSGAALPLTTYITSGAAFASRSVTNAAILSVSTLIPTLSSGSIIGASIAVRTGTIIERHDGTAPTNDSAVDYGPGASGGALLTACGSDLTNLKITANSGTAALVLFYFYTTGR